MLKTFPINMKMKILSILILSLSITIIEINSQLINPTDIHSLRKNTLGLSTKQDLIPVKLGISENQPNTRIMAYADLNRDKL